MAPWPLPLSPGAMVEPDLMLPTLRSMEAPSEVRASIGFCFSVGVSPSESMGAGSSWSSEMYVEVESLRSRRERRLSASQSLSMAIGDGFGGFQASFVFPPCLISKFPLSILDCGKIPSWRRKCPSQTCIISMDNRPLLPYVGKKKSRYQPQNRGPIAKTAIVSWRGESMPIGEVGRFLEPSAKISPTGKSNTTPGYARRQSKSWMYTLNSS